MNTNTVWGKTHGGFVLSQILILSLLLSLGCSKAEETTTPKPVAAKDPLDIPLTDELRAGKEIWMGTCTNCHMHGIGGAPKIGDKKAWAPRIAKGEEVLFGHAINGFISEDGSLMPEKGGNKDLTDEQVKMAVKFMITASQ